MAYYQILYWQDLPAQIKAWDDFDETKIDLGPSFIARIDQAAQALGLTERAAKHLWTHARAWLFAEIEAQRGQPSGGPTGGKSR